MTVTVHFAVTDLVFSTRTRKVLPDKLLLQLMLQTAAAGARLRVISPFPPFTCLRSPVPRYRLFSYVLSESSPTVDHALLRMAEVVLLHGLGMQSEIVTRLTHLSDSELNSGTQICFDYDGSNAMFIEQIVGAQHLCARAISGVVAVASARIGWRHEMRRLMGMPLVLPLYAHAVLHRIVRKLTSHSAGGSRLSIYSHKIQLIQQLWIGTPLLGDRGITDVVSGQLQEVQHRHNGRSVAIIKSERNRVRTYILDNDCDPSSVVGKTVLVITQPARGKIFNRIVGWHLSQSEMF